MIFILGPTGVGASYVVGGLLANTSQSGAASTAQAAVHESRIVAIGDVHGAFSEVTKLLRGAGLINNDNNWVGGRDRLVSVGDLIDRGAQSRQVLDFFIKLQGQAAESGGAVHVLLGNHEAMNLTGILQDVSAAEMASYGGPSGHAELFSNSGKYGAWLVSLPTIIKLGDTLFVHGGLSSTLAGMSIEEINGKVQLHLRNLVSHASLARATLEESEKSADLFDVAQQVANLINRSEITSLPELTSFVESANADILANAGPHWYRGNAGCHAIFESKKLSNILHQLGAKRVVVGHTPTPTRQLRSRLNGQVIAIDTGMLKAVYKGKAIALEILGGRLQAITDTGERLDIASEAEQYAAQTSEIYSDASFAEVRLSKANQIQLDEDQTDLAQSTKRGKKSTSKGMRYKVKLSSGSRYIFTTLGNSDSALTQAKKEEAAYRIDQLLGLNIVDLAVVREIDGQYGVLKPHTRLVSERLRAEKGYSKPNYCERGNEYFLLAAIDSLLGMRQRNADNLTYTLPHWSIRVQGFAGAFPHDSSLNRYSSPQSIPLELVERLEKLNVEQLDEQVGGVLSRRQMKAILKRRDKLLEWPRLE